MIRFNVIFLLIGIYLQGSFKIAIDSSMRYSVCDIILWKNNFNRFGQEIIYCKYLFWKRRFMGPARTRCIQVDFPVIQLVQVIYVS